jgi:hypothetical protein
MTSDQKVNLFIISNVDEGHSSSHAVYLSKHAVRSRTQSKDGASDPIQALLFGFGFSYTAERAI